MNHKIYLCHILFLCILGQLYAKTIDMVQEQNAVTIPRQQTQEFQFSTVPQANTTVLLKIKSRMNLPALSGSLFFMKLTLNGYDIKPYKGRTGNRLVNKPLISPILPQSDGLWYDTDKWRVLYSPDFKAAHTQKYYVDDPYLYVLDITDLCNPIAENRLEITNTVTLTWIQSHNAFLELLPPDTLDLVIGLLQIETKPVSSPLMTATEKSAAKIINRGEPAAGPATYQGEILSGGGFALHIGKNIYSFNSNFSYPNAGFNKLVAGEKDTAGEKDWKVSIDKNNVIATGKEYKIEREINFGKHVTIRDTITNLNEQAPLGILVRNELNIPFVENIQIRLAGSSDPARYEYYSPGNPSVHLVTADGGLGIIAEDDVFRYQSKLYIKAKEKTNSFFAGIRTDMLRLAPRESYTLEWSVYPVAGPDYYDFINLVREDWGANYTALGPWRWGVQFIDKLNDQKLGALFKQQGINYFIFIDRIEWLPNPSGSQRIAYGTDVFNPYWNYLKEKDAIFIKRLNQVSPNTKILGYFHMLRETADDTLARFKDSLVLDAKGKPIITMWKNTGATNPSYLMVPTLDNSFGKAIYETAKQYINDLGVGIYNDEAENIAFNQMLLSYSNFDGHTCFINPKTFTIEREVGIIPLASKPFRDKLVKMIQASGKPLLVNGPTGSKQTLKDKVQRMVEVQHNDYYAFEGNLQTPLGYMSQRCTWKDFLRAFDMATLPADCFKTELDHDISPYLFPFTTLEIHTGYMLAKERIVVTHSGNYGWVNQRDLVKVLHFDTNGKLTNKDFITTINSESRTKVELAEHEAVVLVRIPVSLIFDDKDKNIDNWEAQVSKVKYSEAGIKLNLKTSLGGILKVLTGKFNINNNIDINVEMNGNSYTIKSQNDCVSIKIPKGFNGEIWLKK